MEPASQRFMDEVRNLEMQMGSLRADIENDVNRLLATPPDPGDSPPPKPAFTRFMGMVGRIMVEHEAFIQELLNESE